MQEVIKFDKFDYLIVGIGLNTNIAPISKSFKSTSLKNILDKKINNQKILKKFIIIYEKFLKEKNKLSFSDLKKEIHKDIMNFIVGDIGNTSTRICLLNNRSKILRSVIFDTKNIFLRGYINKIFKKLFRKNVKKDILFSCVVPLAFQKIKSRLKKIN